MNTKIERLEKLNKEETLATRETSGAEIEIQNSSRNIKEILVCKERSPEEIKLQKLRNQNIEKIEHFLRGRDEVFVWKLLEERRLGENSYRSCHSSRYWDFDKQRIFEINRSSKPTKWELEEDKVGDGFTAYVFLRDVLKEEVPSYQYAIAKFKVSKEDIIILCKNNERIEAGCRRLEFIEIVD